MKYEKNFYTRLYVFQLLDAYFSLEENRKKSISLEEIEKISIDNIFSEYMNYKLINLNLDLKNTLINNYIKEEKYFNEIRLKFQNRHEELIDFILIIIINMSMVEYLSYDISNKIIIHEYLNLCSLFSNAIHFTHGIMDKSLKEIEKRKSQKIFNI